MSVTDPLIKDIKGHALQLFHQSRTGKISDESADLQMFCVALERIFYKGLVQNGSVFLLKRSEPYRWMSALRGEEADIASFNYGNSLEAVEGSKGVRTSLGKFRLLVRHCLSKGCLHVPLKNIRNLSKASSLYGANSIIGDEILLDIFLSVLLQCAKIGFHLQLNNTYFLDVTWQMPDLLQLELVPCDHLGIAISFSDNKAVIVNIKPNSVVADDGRISKGDILANLNGVDITSSCRGRLSPIVKLAKGKPINLFVIKSFHKQSDDVFQPIKKILRHLQVDLIGKKEVAVTKKGRSGYKGTYLGSVNVGSCGNITQIEEGIRRCLKLENVNGKRKVCFEMGEMSIQVLDAETEETIFRHSYMEISSCGSAAQLPGYIAYIVGDESCDSASDFACYVFYVKSYGDACQILQNIGQGFHRTHFAV